MNHNSQFFVALALAGVGTACSKPLPPQENGSSTHPEPGTEYSSSEGASDAPTLVTSSTTSSSESTTSDSEGNPTSSEGTTNINSDPSETSGTFPTECVPWQDSCPRGEKCLPYASQFRGYFDRYGCFELVPRPDLIGQECSTLEYYEMVITQSDSCGLGAICLDDLCMPLCSGEPDSWSCPPKFGCLGLDFEPFCLPSCDPLDVQLDCAMYDSCIVNGAGFFQCAPAAQDQAPLFADCLSDTNCGASQYCENKELVKECGQNSGERCCNALCDLDNGICPGDSVCLPFFAEPTYPEYEDLGKCMMSP